MLHKHPKLKGRGKGKKKKFSLLGSSFFFKKRKIFLKLLRKFVYPCGLIWVASHKEGQEHKHLAKGSERVMIHFLGMEVLSLIVKWKVCEKWGRGLEMVAGLANFWHLSHFL